MLNFKKIGLSITEIAELTNLSRPTMYKYLDMYVAGNGAYIRHDLYLLLEYIEQNEDLSKKDVFVFYDQLTKKKE